MSKKRLILALSLTTYLAAACSTDEDYSATLLMSDAGTGSTDESPAAQARRERMNITATLGDAVSTTPWSGSAFEVARDYLLDDCLVGLSEAGELPLSCFDRETIRNSDSGCVKRPDEVPLCEPSAAEGHSCEVAVCRVQVAACIAHRLLEVGSAVSTTSFVRRLDINLPRTLTIPPQDEESKVALTEEAFKYAAWAATVAGNNLRSMVKDKKKYDSSIVGVCDAAVAKTPLLLERSYSEWLASSLSEATLVADEAARTAVQHHLAVADATFSEVPDLGEATRMAWVGGNISRARAAHILFGGQYDKGLKDTPKGFCPVEPLSDTAKEAQSVIQAVGPSPSVVYDPNVPFIALFAGVPKPTGSTALDDSLRARLAERSGNPSFAT
ncbi:MAG: hypothetical protein V2A73_02410, partial [Pseudomonadota bacterium]